MAAKKRKKSKKRAKRKSKGGQKPTAVLMMHMESLTKHIKRRPGGKALLERHTQKHGI
jgi:hypothetical protein